MPQVAPGCSAVPQADGTRDGAALCPLYSMPWFVIIMNLIGTNSPRISSCRKLHLSSDECVIAGAAL